MNTIRFDTNQRLSNEEQHHVQQLLLQATHKLRDARDQAAGISELQLKLFTEISHYNVAVAPWKRVPEHVLQLIFLWCLPHSGVVIPGRSAEACLTLTAVCSSWRKLALNTPELWKAVTVRLWRRHSQSIISIAHQWLERAGNRARMLEIDVDTPDHEGVFDQLVLPFRFRKLNITVEEYDQSCPMIEKILSLPPERTQSLVALRVATSEKYTAMDSNAKVVSPKDQRPFSNLQILCFEGPLTSHQSMAMSIPWEQLRQLSLRDKTFSSSVFLNILQRCVALEELKVTMGSDNGSELPAPSLITLPNLRQVDLCFVYNSYPEVFFRSLVLPNIEEFSVHGSQLTCTSQSFADMAQRSGMDKLQRLFLDKGEEPYHLDHLLKYTPSLTRLEVRGKVVLDSQLLEDVLKGRLGPNLKELLMPQALFAGVHKVDRLIKDLLFFRWT